MPSMTLLTLVWIGSSSSRSRRRGALLELLGPLLELLLLPLEVLPLGRALRGAQHDRLLLEVRGRRVEAGLELLDLAAIGLRAPW